MIVPMKKVSLVVFNRERSEALEKLREAGVVHLEKRGVLTADLSVLQERRARAESAQGILQPYADKKKKPLPGGDGEAIIAQTLALSDERKALQETLAAADRELSRIEKWGDFDPDGLRDLEAAGLALVPYELSGEAFDALPEEVQVLVLSRDKTLVRFLVIGAALEGEIPFGLPEKSLHEITGDISAAQERIITIDGELSALAAQGPALALTLSEIRAQIEFESAQADMETLEEIDPGKTVSWLRGYIPQEELGILKRTASENGWALLAEDPEPEDNVPTKLKNNRLVSLIYPLMSFMEITPGYNEVDISGWFLLFFSIFFGMIFGDAGYGTLLFIIGIVAVLKTKKTGVPQAIKMLLLLALTNVLWGVLTCTWFGVEPVYLPQVLKSLSLPLISNAVAAESEAAKAIVDQNLMIFCFSLALLQLGVGHVIGIVRNIRSPRLLGDLGNLGMLVGMYNVVLTLVASNDYRQIPFLPVSLYLIAGGFVLTFLFSNYENGIGQSILESLKNIISMILGIANIFSDVMSYIRLWAVGLAGASISATVNTMAGPLLGNFLIFLGIILLIFGHGLNIMLNVLSVLVHGVRLNTLEFSTHVGLSWSGTAYRPFAKR
ncbi:MAG: V-type ATP synthase subunit I [Spirochaetaceae bacterium]|jgi:V/A-type H+-transporting ATPase subunit I|nr:V-type ATP synthase subunit I [Spirochaetaceae bacterium]